MGSRGITALDNIAASQWGMFTAAQARAVEVQSHQITSLVREGRAEQLSYGVYRFVSSAEVADPDVKAAWLSLKPEMLAPDRLASQPYDAVVAGRTAAHVHGVGDFYATPYTFIVRKRRQTRRADLQLWTRSLDESDVTMAGTLPVTTLERTFADLILADEDPSLVDDAMQDAARAGRVLEEVRLGELLGPAAKRNGYASGPAFAAVLIARNMAPIQMRSSVESALLAMKHLTKPTGAVSAAAQIDPQTQATVDDLLRAFSSELASEAPASNKGRK